MLLHIASTDPFIITMLIRVLMTILLEPFINNLFLNVIEVFILNQNIIKNKEYLTA